MSDYVLRSEEICLDALLSQLTGKSTWAVFCTGCLTQVGNLMEVGILGRCNDRRTRLENVPSASSM